jgi:hypothetical protein
LKPLDDHLDTDETWALGRLLWASYCESSGSKADVSDL